eukprot:500955_1
MEEDYPVTRELLLSGYFREMEVIINHNIPPEICQIITLYQNIIIIYATGNQNGFFGLNNNMKYCKYTNLKELQLLATSPENIFPNSNSLMVIGNNNELFVAGNNNYQRLGIKVNEKYDTIYEFTKIELNKEIKLASIGCYNDSHTFILTQNNELYVSGNNFSSTFGNGKKSKDYNERCAAQHINTTFLSQNENIIYISCGSMCTMFLTNTGSLYSTGKKMVNGLGVNTETPILINMNNNNIPIIKVSCGYDNNLALDEMNRLIVWGDNDYGQSSSNRDCARIDMPTFHDYFHAHNIQIIHICAGYSFSLCIDIDNNCYMFGENDCAQIGNGKLGETCEYNVYKPFKVNDRMNVKIIDGNTGDSHTVLLSDNNDVITFGDNSFFQCSSLMNCETILEPYIVSKSKEIGISESCFIEKVMAVIESTIVFVNPSKQFIKS